MSYKIWSSSYHILKQTCFSMSLTVASTHCATLRYTNALNNNNRIIIIIIPAAGSHKDFALQRTVYVRAPSTRQRQNHRRTDTQRHLRARQTTPVAVSGLASDAHALSQGVLSLCTQTPYCYWSYWRPRNTSDAESLAEKESVLNFYVNCYLVWCKDTF